MNIQALRYYKSLAETKNFTKAVNEFSRHKAMPPQTALDWKFGGHHLPPHEIVEGRGILIQFWIFDL